MTLTRLLRIGLQRLRSLAKKERADEELDRELAFHLAQLIRENTEAGLTAREAELAARRALGNVALLEDQCRDQRCVGWLHDIGQDALHGLRMLRRNPAFAVIAALSLALGIGANAAVLGVIRNVALGTLALPDADRLVVIRTFSAATPERSENATLPQFLDWRDHAAGFEAVGTSLPQERDFGVRDGFPAERISGQAVSHEFFPVLGVQPMLGRVFSPTDDEIDHPAPLVILSYGLWQGRFAADPNIVGKPAMINGAPLTVIGVMPAGFRYPLDETQFWVPLSTTRLQLRGTANFFTVTARLKPGVTIQQAQAGLEAIAHRRARDFPETDKDIGVRVQALREAELGWTRQPLFTLEAAVALVLLIACANLAALLIARGSARGPELAMRAALGAGRGRIIRQFLTESVLLSLIGGVLGIAVAWGAARALTSLAPPPSGLHLHDAGLDLGTLGLIALISMVSGLVFGVAPALAGSRLEATRGVAGRRQRQRFQSALVAAQFALALAALTGSGLLLKSFLRLAARDLNFQPEGLLSFELRLPLNRYFHIAGSSQGLLYANIDPPTSRVMQRLLDRFRELPGVVSVAGISYPLLESRVLPKIGVKVEGASAGPNGPPTAAHFFVTPNLFATLRTPILRGRDFDEDDTVNAPWKAIVNETAARLFWPGQDPLGKRFTLDIVPEEQPREVIAVVRDVPLERRQAEPRPVIYTSYLQQPSRYREPWYTAFGQMTFLLRGQGDPMSLLPSARWAALEIEPDVPLSKVERLERLGGNLRSFGGYTLTVGLFALAALVLASIGIYGVTAYAVAQRTREIGVRIAMGAGSLQVAGLIGKLALAPVAAGLLLGLGGSLLAARMIGSQLWGVQPFDRGTFAGVVGLLVLVAAAASWIPGKRAIQVDPAVALRSE